MVKPLVLVLQVEKVVFIVFFSGEQARTKILKICEAFGASCYPVPEDIIKRRQIIQEVLSRLSDLETTLDAGLRHRDKALTSIGCELTKWMNTVRKEKAVYDTLNMLNFDVTKKCLLGEGWCPIFAKTKVLILKCFLWIDICNCFLISLKENSCGNTDSRGFTTCNI
nr:V-type proton ATPase subunit A1-like [Ipomoea batatas]